MFRPPKCPLRGGLKVRSESFQEIFGEFVFQRSFLVEGGSSPSKVGKIPGDRKWEDFKRSFSEASCAWGRHGVV